MENQTNSEFTENKNEIKPDEIKPDENLTINTTIKNESKCIELLKKVYADYENECKQLKEKCEDLIRLNNELNIKYDKLFYDKEFFASVKCIKVKEMLQNFPNFSDKDYPSYNTIIPLTSRIVFTVTSINNNVLYNILNIAISKESYDLIKPLINGTQSFSMERSSCMPHMHAEIYVCPDLDRWSIAIIDDNDPNKCYGIHNNFYDCSLYPFEIGNFNRKIL